jgi:hypothetical protein
MYRGGGAGRQYGEQSIWVWTGGNLGSGGRLEVHRKI